MKEIEAKDTNKIEHLQPDKNFECIIDTPLCSGEGTNHDNTKRKSTSTKTQQTHLLHSLHQNMEIYMHYIQQTKKELKQKHPIKNILGISQTYNVLRQAHTSPTVAPLALLRKETRLSAG